jgi:cobalt transporter subunit CbtB
MNNQVVENKIFNEAVVDSSISKPLQLVAAFILGAVVIYGAGFLKTSVVHNAAHDMRHSQGFPCH